MLDDKRGYQCFYEFLQIERMEDIVVFYKEVKNFEKSFKYLEKNDSIKAAEEIINKFLISTSKNALNVNDKESQYYRNLIETDKLYGDSFNKTLVDQLFLITNDPLLRYSLTDNGKEFIKKYKIPPYYKEILNAQNKE
jgi:hypothetical protein